MRIEPLGVLDAWALTPQVHRDDRGSFLEWFRADMLDDAIGRRFEARQANHSVSARGVVRGIHYADVPPGQAKLVYCPVGSVLDVVVDLRVGSPTFGRVDSVLLDAADPRMVFVSEGLGHAFCALAAATSVAYLVSTEYNPVAERTIAPLDTELALPWPSDIGGLRLSEKDSAAPTLAQARTAGILPAYEQCREWYATS